MPGRMAGGLAWLAGGVLVILAMAWLVYVELVPGPGQVIIEWTTASEVNTAGFNLARADTPDGAYRQVNAELIPSSTDPMLGGQYTYTDSGVISGRTYYYQLEDVEYTGTLVHHGPLEAQAQPAHPPMSSWLWWVMLAGGAGLSLAGFLQGGRPKEDKN
ncbi:MAG: hypothetical protein JW850_04735 [Thermoflexales bacterium]|nr:hypothetical protein [Thermoflexales bacterium]